VAVGQLLLERKVIRAVRHIGLALFATWAVAGGSETGSDARAGTQGAVARNTLVECWAGAGASGGKANAGKTAGIALPEGRVIESHDEWYDV
jgi:hypothetical protein